MMSISRSLCVALLLFVPCLAQDHVHHHDKSVPDESRRGLDLIDLAGIGEEAAHLRFAVLDAAGGFIPSRITFVGEKDKRPTLFKNRKTAPENWAVRRNVVYTTNGVGFITVPPGTYTIYASRGLEWSVGSRKMKLEAGKEYLYSQQLTHEVKTKGWVSGDCHLHTLTYSGHGDSNLDERIVSLVGEGVEFAVATDHNHTTDYTPTVRKLDQGEHVHPVRGNEISVPIGHLNVFPLPHWDKHPYRSAHAADELFKFLRANGENGIDPVIQLNHPRWGSIDFFGHMGLDPVTGTSDNPTWSDDFDTLEILNENPGWGYRDADHPPHGLGMGSSEHQVLQDWFNLLNRGHRHYAVGNSDSHTVEATIAGVPRNFVHLGIDAPKDIDNAKLARALKEGHCFTTSGPFVLFSVNGKTSGSETGPDARGGFDVDIEIRCASWIDCDRVKVVHNGDVILTLPVPQERKPLRLKTRLRIPTLRDGWLLILVEGDDSLAPIVHDAARPCFPVAILNPVFIDGNGDGRVEAPLVQVRRWLAEGKGAWAMDGLPRSLARLMTIEAALSGNAKAAELVRRLLRGDRGDKIAAFTAARLLANRSLEPDVEAAEVPNDDPWMGALQFAALGALGADGQAARLESYHARFGDAATRRYADRLLTGLESASVARFRVLRFFPNPKRQGLWKNDLDVVTDSSMSAAHKGAVGGGEAHWEIVPLGENGMLRLDTKTTDGTVVGPNTVAFAGFFLDLDEARTIPYMLGSDDGCRVWLDGQIVYDHHGSHAASLSQHLGFWKLAPGRHRVLIGIENGGGPMGLRLKLFGRGVRTAAE